jgi:regulatory protein
MSEGRRVKKKRLDASKLTFDALKEAALRYLDQRDASVVQVRRVLMRRVALASDPAVVDEARAQVEQVLARLLELGLLDDERFARAFALGQRRRGVSSLGLRAKLAARGLAAENVESALEHTLSDLEHNEQASALTYARKRRLAERFDLDDPTHYQKALGSLARRGFSFDVARQALEQLRKVDD